MTTFDKIREWGIDKGLTGKNGKATIAGQMQKLDEEHDELVLAVADKNRKEMKDAIGDMIVVLTLLADLLGMSVENCIDSAYDVISKRNGTMQNGVFVKDTQ